MINTTADWKIHLKKLVLQENTKMHWSKLVFCFQVKVPASDWQLLFRYHVFILGCIFKKNSYKCIKCYLGRDPDVNPEFSGKFLYAIWSEIPLGNPLRATVFSPLPLWHCLKGKIINIQMNSTSHYAHKKCINVKLFLLVIFATKNTFCFVVSILSELSFLF